MFTNDDLRAAIAEGIFDANNNVTATPARIIRFFEKWAAEHMRDIRHAAAEIAISIEDKDEAHNAIMNLNFS